MTPVNYPQQPVNVDYMNNSQIQCPLLLSQLSPVHKITFDTKEEKMFKLQKLYVSYGNVLKAVSL